MKQAISKLNSGKSPGPDGLETEPLKLLADLAATFAKEINEAINAKLNVGLAVVQ